MCSTDDLNSYSDMGNNNSSILLPEYQQTNEEKIYHNIRYISQYILFPVIFGFGIIGNALNILIFMRGKFRSTLDVIEKSSTFGLVALAISDLLYCCFGFPEAFLMRESRQKSHTLEVITLYYKCYKGAFMNIFLFSSTWLIVVISIERYVAVVYPLKARWMVQIKHTIIIDVMVYIFSFVCSIPGFLQYHVVQQHSPCSNRTVTYAIQLSDIYASIPFIYKRFYHVIWTILGTFIPLFILIVCNIRLLVEVYRSHRHNSTEQHRYSTSKITFILMAVILVYLVLVCPSKLLAFITNFTSLVKSSDKRHYYRYFIAVRITWFALNVNFAVNFLLYCVISKPFRENLSNMIYGCARRKRDATPTCTSLASQQYDIVDNNGTMVNNTNGTMLSSSIKANRTKK